MSKNIPQILEHALERFQSNPPGPWTLSDELRALRARLGLTQEGFSDRYAIPLANLQNWEQPARSSKPDAAARLLIKMIMADPDRVAEIVRKVRDERPDSRVLRGR